MRIESMNCFATDFIVILAPAARGSSFFENSHEVTRSLNPQSLIHNPLRYRKETPGRLSLDAEITPTGYNGNES